MPAAIWSSSPSICSSMACASDQYASLSRTIAAPSSDDLVGEVPVQPPRDTPATSATSETVVERMPLARRHTSAASISRSRTLLRGRAGWSTGRLLVISQRIGANGCILPSGPTVPCDRPEMVDTFRICSLDPTEVASDGGHAPAAASRTRRRRHGRRSSTAIGRGRGANTSPRPPRRPPRSSPPPTRGGRCTSAS